MDEQEQTQSAELSRIEEMLREYPKVVPMWSELLAWCKNREATEALLLGLVKKLTPAAEETPTECICAGLPYWDPKCPMHGLIETPDPPATPQPACRHPWEHLPTQRLVMGSAYEWCGHCGALWDGSRWIMPTQPPAPQQTEG